MKRAFASLDAQEALQVAIFIEDRNAGIYQRFAEMFTEFSDPDSLEIANVFWEMADEERGHGTVLRDKYKELYGDAECATTEEELLEFIEVPELRDDELFPALPLPSGQARARALQVALEAELAAQRFYHMLAENTKDGPLRRLYDELAGMEDGHVGFIQSKLVASTFVGTSVQ